MFKSFKTGLVVLFSLIAVAPSLVVADEVADRISAALDDPARDEAERARDDSRKPIEVVSFIGIETGMSVIDMAAGAGWYSEVLAAAVGPEGRVIAQNVPRFEERSGPALAKKKERYPNIEPTFLELAELDLDGQMDAAWTALNLHDYTNRGRENGLTFLQAIYKALKPGGVLAVIDHEGSAGNDNAVLHRMEAAVAIQLLQEAGFVVESQSDLLDNPADDRSLHMRDESLERNTDRFLIRAIKPM